MKKPKIKSIGYGFYCILMIIISVLGFILYNLGNWVLDTWGLLSIDEIIFHLKVPLDGTNSDVVLDGINACVPLAVLVLFLSIFLIIGLRNKHGKCMIALFLVAVIACGSAGRAAYEVYDELDVKEYLVSQKEESHFIEQNYVDPRTTKITFPDKKRNLIYIYLESMESTFALYPLISRTFASANFSYRSVISATAQCKAPDAFFGSVTTGIIRCGIPL